MIVVEDRVLELLGTLPDITVKDSQGADVVFSMSYDFGSAEDLDLFLKQETKKYPLVWLENGFSETHSTDKSEVQASLSFKIATYGLDSTLLNQVRLNSTFKDVLFPVLENVRKALERSNITLLQSREFEITKFYNYGSDQAQEQSEIWDAIKFDVDVKFNNDCLKPFSYG